MADLLEILTNDAGLTAAEYGVGPAWIKGVEYWSDGNAFVSSRNAALTSSKSLGLLDGITGKITLPKTYILATDGDYIEWLGRLDEYHGGTGGAALGLIGLDNGSLDGWLGYSSSNGKIAIRETGASFKDVTVYANTEQYKFHRIRVTQTNATTWTISVDGADQATITRDGTLSVNNMGQGYSSGYCQATLAELSIVTEVTGNLILSNFATDIADKKLLSAGVTFAEMSYTAESIIALRSKAIAEVGNRETIFIYVPQEDSDSYIKYDYAHGVNAGIAADVWRIRSAYIVDAVEFPLVWGDERLITTTGEWENAVRITGEADFFGGENHGNDETFSNTVLLEGSYVDLSNLNLFAGDYLTLKQSSQCYKGTKTINVAQSDRTWVFNPEGVVLSNKLTWKTSESLDNSYLTMIPVLRDDGTGKLTEFGLWGTDPTPVDISTTGFTVVNNPESVIACYGDTSGLSIHADIKKGWGKPNAITWLTNSSTYNKIYCDFTKDYSVSAGEVFDAETSITFKLTN